MAYFKIDYLNKSISNKDNWLGYFPATMSEFYPQIQGSKEVTDAPFRHHTFSYTYDENLQLHQNSQKSLTFKLNQKINYNDEWITNPFSSKRKVGALILLTDKYNNQFLFVITNISFEFKNDNTVYSITCQDAFSYQTSRQNKGYTINNDPSSENFIGAKTLDWWAQKIAEECHMQYVYIPLFKTIYQSKNGLFFDWKDTLGSTSVDKVLRDSFTPSDYPEYYTTFPLAISASSAKNALISAGQNAEMDLVARERLVKDPETGNWYLQRYFWFSPKKNPKRVTGRSYSPRSDINNFNLAFSSDSLTTVLNINSSSTDGDDGKTVTLFPEITPFFSQLFQSKLWSNPDDRFYPGYFTKRAYGTLITLNSNIENSFSEEKTGTIADGVFSGTSTNPTHTIYTLDREKNTVLYNYIQDYISLYTRISFSYHHKNSQIKGVGTLFLDSSVDSFALYIWKKDNLGKGIFLRDGEEFSSEILQFLKDNPNPEDINISILLPVVATGINSTNYIFYLYFNQQPTQEDLNFAEIADKAPWLENKLMDFSWFLNQKAITPEQYSILKDLVENKLRRVNGRLLLYANQYYSALKKKTEIVSNITNSLDTLGASMEADLLSPYAETGTEQYSPSFDTNYSLTLKTDTTSKYPMLDYDKLVSKYAKLAFNAEQRFLKNRYYFRRYFESPVQTLWSGDLQEGEITITTDLSPIFDPSFTSGTYIVPRNASAGYTAATRDSLYYNKNTGEPLTKIYKKVKDSDNNYQYSEVEVVTKNNYKNYYFSEDNSVKTENGRLLLTKPCGAGVNYYVSSTSTEKLSLYPSLDEAKKGIIDLEWENSVPKDKYIRDTSDEGRRKECDTEWWKLQNGNGSVNENEWKKGFAYLNPRLFAPVANTSLDKEKRLSSIINSSEILNWKDDNIKKACVECYIRNFPVQEIYYYNASNKNYNSVPLVNENNEGSYYRQVSNLSKTGGGWATAGIATAATALIAVAGSPALTGAAIICSIIFGNKLYDALLRASGSHLALEGESYHDLKKVETLDLGISGWDSNQQLAWYRTTIDNAQSIINGITYDTTKVDQNNVGTVVGTINNDSLPYIAQTYNSVFRFKQYYSKTSWWKPISSEGNINSLDTYEFLFLGEEGNNSTVDDDLNKGGVFLNLNSAIRVLSESRLNQDVFYPLQSAMTAFNVKLDSNTEVITLRQMLENRFGLKNISNVNGSNYIFKGTFSDSNGDNSLYNAIGKTTDTFYFAILRDEPFERINFDDDSYYSLWKNRHPKTDISFNPNSVYTTQELKYQYNDEFKGKYYTDTLSASLKQADVWDQDKAYYNSLAERIYTAHQLTDQADIYVSDQYTYKYYFLTNNLNNGLDITFPVSKIKVTKDENGVYNSNVVNANLEVSLTINNSNSNTSKEPIVGKYTDESGQQNSCSFSGTVSTTSLNDSSLTNGDFWYKYNSIATSDNADSISLVNEQCALIESQLETYWSQAYAASKYCKYFLPEHWQKYDGSTLNYFNKDIYSKVGLGNNSSGIKLLTKYIPLVYIISDDEEGINSSEYTYDYNWDYSTEPLEKINSNSDLNAQNYISQGYNTISYDSASRNIAIKDFFTNNLEQLNIGKAPLKHWTFTQTGKRKYYYADPSTGTTWESILNKISSSGKHYTLYSGLYNMTLEMLDFNYKKASMTNYNELLEQHNKIWNDIYSKYSDVVLEDSYSTDQATNSLELYNFANSYLKDMHTPEKAYSISLIDTASIKGYNGQEIYIGDPILVEANNYHQITTDDIYETLNQYLFVSDISYSLRNDGSRQLTVNDIKYQDKMIKALAKLIR